MELFPAIDVRDGRSVRLVQGDFSRETIYGDPVDRARELLGAGASWLHVVDLDAAVSGLRVNRGVVERIAEITRSAGASLQVGGGVRDEDAVRELLGVGVTRVVLGTAALADPEMVTRFAATHARSIVVGLDYRREVIGERRVLHGDPSDVVSEMMLATEGWTTGGVASMEDALAWFEGTGVAAVIVTDIGRDGTLTGPDIEGLAAIVAMTEIAVVASGGVSCLDDLVALGGVAGDGRTLGGAIVGKALLEERFSLGDALIALGSA